MAPAAASNPARFAKDEKALCFHHEYLYEAKILDVRRVNDKDKTSPHEYRVHYKGWKNTWDDWVPEDRLRKFTDENRELAANLKKDLLQPQTTRATTKSASSGKKGRGLGSDLGSGRGSEERQSSVPAGARGTKRGKDNELEKVGLPVFPSPEHKSNLDRPLSVDAAPLSPSNLPSAREREAWPVWERWNTVGTAPGAKLHPGPVGEPWAYLPIEDFQGFDGANDGGESISEDESFGGAAETTIAGNTPSQPVFIFGNQPQLFTFTYPYRNQESSNNLPDITATQPSTRERTQRKPPSKYGCQLCKVAHIECDKTEPSCARCTREGLICVYSSASPDQSAGNDSEEYPDEDSEDSPDSVELHRELKPSADGAVYLTSASSKKRRDRMARTKNVREAVKPSNATSPEQESADEQAKEVDELLSRSPPPDQPERFSRAARNDPHWASLIGGTTLQEQAAIQQEAPSRRQHRRSDDQRGEKDADDKAMNDEEKPESRKPVAGVAKDPITIDAPGSGGPFDALKHPKQLVEKLDRLTTPHRNTLIGWKTANLLKIPAHLLGNLRPETLAALPYVVLVNQPKYVKDKLPKNAPFCQLPSKDRRPGKKANSRREAAQEPPYVSLFEQLQASAPKYPTTAFIPEERAVDDTDPSAESDHPQEEAFRFRPSVRIAVPDHLKAFLVDDWENVTKSLLLVALPSRAPVNFIVNTYFEEEKGLRRLGSAQADILEEFVEGLKVYFEKSIGKILLYRYERAQYAEIRQLWESGRHQAWIDKGPGDCYGAEHLARMLVNMPEIIAQTNMDEQSIERLRIEISKLCQYLARNSARFFINKYEKPDAQYIENNRES